MNSKQKSVVIVGLILIVAALAWWLISGGEILSKDGIWVEQELSELDKSLGLEPQQVYQPKIVWGLLPHFAGISGAIVAISAILFFIFKTKK